MTAIAHVLKRPLLSNHFSRFWLSTAMARGSIVDTSPPVHRELKDKLDRSLFHKTIQVLAVKVPPAKAGTILKAEAMRGTIIDFPKMKSVLPTQDGERLVLLRFGEEDHIPDKARYFLASQAGPLQPHSIELGYDYWTADDILGAILPEELLKGAPSGFATVGHVAHLNLNEEYLPYKYLIGEVVLDKNRNIRTVVNKLNSIHSQFRYFQMELLAGEPDYVVEHSESDCRFTFDFSKVYWNSRLHTEHARLVSSFTREDVVADVFAGVGPFALPAARKGCAVLANDLNPESYKYLDINIQNNKVSTLVRSSCEDGKDFIRSSVIRVLDQPFPPPRNIISKTQQLRAKKLAREEGKLEQGPANEFAASTTDLSGCQRQRITQYVMNLPDSAITFLGAFRGLLSAANAGGRDLSGVYDADSSMPTVHCYCFAREPEPEKAEINIRERVEEQLGGPLEAEVSLFHVRSVAPNKEMYCISFRLPRTIAFAS
ncbi:Met-10+ like-protein-domain-containing protein [Cytidiella melzeri]|nr:Met-10+ like-protein-domain-containing protein [Cytidiella melzeri]